MTGWEGVLLPTFGQATKGGGGGGDVLRKATSVSKG
jgi:hypothetical protein